MKNVTCLLRGQQEGVRVQANQTNVNLQEGGDQVKYLDQRLRNQGEEEAPRSRCIRSAATPPIGSKEDYEIGRAKAVD